MSTATDATKQTKVSTESGQKDENVFNAWRAKKEPSQTSPAGGQPTSILKVPDASGRRRSNAARDYMKGAGSMRRMTLIMRAKSDISSEMVAKPQVKKENTYKMKPDEGTGLSHSRVHRAVEQLLQDECDGLEYDRDMTSKLCCELSEKIRDKVKDLGFPRYKIAANVFVSQIADQGMEVASRCCWDHTTDNFISVSYNNKSLLVLALVFGVYFE